MADVFISYRNTPERRIIVRRLATILRAYEISVWWDYGLEAGESYRAQIAAELASAQIVSPLWCAESIESPWVRTEAELGKDKLLPARLQKVVPPAAFEAIQAADLIGWDGAVGNPRLLAFVRLVCRRLGRPGIAPTDMIEDLGQLPPVTPLPEVVVVATPSSIAAAELQFAQFRAEARIKVDAAIFSPVDSAATKAGWLKPGAGRIETFRDLAIGPEMLVIPGSPTFAVSRFPVTFAEWDAAQAHPEWKTHTKIEPRMPNDQGWGRGKQPVIDVSWNDAAAYCDWITAVTGKAYRLPIEAEWEHACRAGTKSQFWWGNEISTAQANYNGNYTFGNGKKGEYRQRTMPVDSFEPNPWGLFQVHGNLWEYCEDAYDASFRMVRGGSWDSYPDGLRSASRNRVLADGRNSSHGFRLVRIIPPDRTP